MTIDWELVHAAVWRPKKQALRAVHAIDPIALDDLVGIDRQKQELLTNTGRFIDNKPANNALLWGARGTGKSSLIKAVFNAFRDRGLRLIELHKNDLQELPDIVDDIRPLPQKFIVFSDDFSFDTNENTYIALKTVLEGSIEQPPDNVIFYVTSNRRHLMPEFMKDNLGTEVRANEIHYSDAVEEKISLSDRFGLWLSFYQPDFDGYLEIVDSYFPDFDGDRGKLHEAALSFAMTRASRSGRTALQFYNSYAEHED